MNSLSLFSGYSGLDLAISDWAKPILYCEKDLYAKGILLSRMDDGSIPFAPIWNDVTTLDGNKLSGLVDLIVGGFPCQDISVAGMGIGLDGERSGLFFEIVRLAKETMAPFVFLENVPAIRTRGLRDIVRTLAEMGYDCRWTCLSASSVGAPHKRERWFLLAYSNSFSIRVEYGRGFWPPGEESPQSRSYVENGLYSDTNGLSKELRQPEKREQNFKSEWLMESDDWDNNARFFLRMGDGDKLRTHRVKALGNGVVPLQAKEAFIKLMGLK